MANTHQNHPQNTQRKSRVQHGRVIDLRSMSAHHTAKKASATVRETEGYARHANRVLRAAFQHYVYAPTKTTVETTRQVAREQVEHFAENTWIRTQRVFKVSWSRHKIMWHTVYSTTAFALIASFVVVPVSVSALVRDALSIKESASVQAESGVDALLRAAAALEGIDFMSAKTEFESAEATFREAARTVRADGHFAISLARFLPVASTSVRSGEALVALGTALSEAGVEISAALEAVSSYTAQQSADNVPSIIPLFQALYTATQSARTHIGEAIQHTQHISVEVLPVEYRDFFQRMSDALPVLYEQTHTAEMLIETILSIAGTTGEKTYLFLFQNNRELRPTGGFIGSIAIVYVKDGVIQSVDVPPGGVYDIAGQLNQRILSPQPLWIVNPQWNIQDANWFPHFPTSAQKVAWFYNTITQETVDGVFTFTPDVLEHLLDITGPVDLTEEYDVIITSDNLYTELQTRAEEKYDVTRESKKIIGDLADRMMTIIAQKLQSPTDVVAIASALRDALVQKHLLAYMMDADTQEQLSAFDWTGELKSTDRDYLGIFYANIAGGKTDQYLQRTTQHRAEIQGDGSVIDTVTLSIFHEPQATDSYSLIKNMSYIRIYVPEGSELLSAQGFDTPDAGLFLEPGEGSVVDAQIDAIERSQVIDEKSEVSSYSEFGKTVFAGWTQTERGEQSQVTIRYRLPWTVQPDQVDHYSLLVQKQPGNFIEKDILQTLITYPESWTVRHRTSDVYGTGEQMLMTTDQLFGIVFSR